MSHTQEVALTPEQWAHFRFSVIGGLLAAPPAPGELQGELSRLAAKVWRHPLTGQPVQYGVATIERWYYKAKHEVRDPVRALARKPRADQGQHPSLREELRRALQEQYRQHKSWSYQLHCDNLAAQVRADASLGPMPSYESVYRYMRAVGLFKQLRRGWRKTAGTEAAEERLERREVRSYESEYVNALWHLDFHKASRPILLPDGSWVTPSLLGILDDCSRLGIHAQWYLQETTENLVHSLIQGFAKRGLCRSLMSDNGSAMIAGETTQGLGRLGIVHEKTLPYSPYQNGKQESFWGQVEGRLLPMLESCPDLALEPLNEATLAWLELEYNRKVHSELGQTPLQRHLEIRDVSRPCPDLEILRQAFTLQVARRQRRSDGTLTLQGVRFEVPAAYRHQSDLVVRYASWDLSRAWLVHAPEARIVARLYPLDKQRNADGRRRRYDPAPGASESAPRPADERPAPLLRQLLAEYAATGLPPPYLPKTENPT